MMQQHWMMARRMSYWMGNHKVKREVDLFKLPIDKHIKKESPKEVKYATVKRVDG